MAAGGAMFPTREAFYDNGKLWKDDSRKESNDVAFDEEYGVNFPGRRCVESAMSQRLIHDQRLRTTDRQYCRSNAGAATPW